MADVLFLFLTLLQSINHKVESYDIITFNARFSKVTKIRINDYFSLLQN